MAKISDLRNAIGMAGQLLRLEAQEWTNRQAVKEPYERDQAQHGRIALALNGAADHCLRMCVAPVEAPPPAMSKEQMEMLLDVLTKLKGRLAGLAETDFTLQDKYDSVCAVLKGAITKL